MTIFYFSNRPGFLNKEHWQTWLKDDGLSPGTIHWKIIQRTERTENYSEDGVNQ